MAELAKSNHAATNGKAALPSVTATSSAGTAVEESIGPEGERERTIAKAAISIAELSE